MNESCDRCHHRRPSHDQWGSGPCAAKGCTCGEYVTPSPWAPDATPEQKEQTLRSLSGGAP